MSDLPEPGHRGGQLCLTSHCQADVLIKMRWPERALVWVKNQPMGRKQAVQKGESKFGIRFPVEFIKKLAWTLSLSILRVFK